MQQQEPDIDAVLAELGEEVQRLVAPPTSFAGDELAGLGRRVTAFLLDTAWYLLSLAAFLLLAALALGDGSIGLEGSRFLLVTFGWSLVWEISWIAAPTRGKPGQRMAGFRVVRPDGSRVSLARAALRWAVRMLAWPTTGLTLVVSAVLVHTTGRRQALHDLAAQTMCVRRAALQRMGEPQFAGSIGLPATRTATADASRRPGDPPRHTGPFV